MSQLSCQNVSFAYEGNVVLEGIDFEVNEGDYLCIIGENGAGKSTLMKGILNLKRPVSGKILTGDGVKPEEIGYLPQQTRVQKDFPASVKEIVQSGRLHNLGFRFFYQKQDRIRRDLCMEKLNIISLKNKCYRNLSGGQQQRVLLARALCSTSKMLLLDEPVTGLDPVMSRELYAQIRRMNREERITIIMVSHDIRGVIEDATHVLHLGSKQMFFGEKEAYKNSSIGKRFLGGLYE